jgi:hypothetical protein
MKKQLLLLATLFLIGIMLPANLHAQDDEDVVYLKNGSVIRGMIVEQVPNQSLKIETRDGNLFVFQMDEVEKMTKRPNGFRAQERGSDTNVRESKFNKPRGWLGLIELGVGSWMDTSVSESVTMVNGYRIFPQLAIGVGAGAEFFNYGAPVIPVFLHLRSDFIKTKVSPFIAVNSGYYVSGTEGLFYEGQAGVSFNVGRKHRMTVGLGYLIDDYSEAAKLKVGFSF